MSDTVTAHSLTGDRQPYEKRKRRGGVRWWWLLVFLAMGALVYGPIWYASLYEKKAAPAAAAPVPVPQAEAPKTHADKQQVENAYFFRIGGKDRQGHPAAFDFIILTNDFTWVKGSTNQVASGDKVLQEAEVVDKVLTQIVRDSLASASDLVAVGLASQEGERTQEEARALERAKTVAGWITQVSKPETALWTLTLGQYDRSCKHQEDAGTSFERPVIFASVRSKEEGANLQEALADAISGHDNLPSRNCYSRFDMEKIR